MTSGPMIPFPPSRATDSSILVLRGSTPAASGAKLAVAYISAIALSPGGATRSDANPSFVILQAGDYDVSNFAPYDTAVRLKEEVVGSVTFVTPYGDVAFADFVQPTPANLATRASTTYDGVNIKQQGQLRTRTLRITNPCTATIDAGAIWAVGGNESLGVFGTTGADVYHRTPTGTGWGSAVGTITSGTIKAIWPLASGTLIAAVDFSGAASKLYRSADYGATWTAELTMTGIDSKGEQGLHWNLHQAAHGTIIFAAYGTTNDDTNDRNIYKSVDDGSTWTIKEAVTADLIDHFHACGYQETLGEWVAAAGDGAEAAMYGSSDDGENWAVIDATLGPGGPMQPVGFLDYGHATNLLFASDGSYVLGTYDVSAADETGITQVFGADGTVDPGSSRHFVFEIFKHGDYYYACTYDNSSSGSAVKRPAILVSDDATNWTTYWRDDSETLRGCSIFAGVSGGFIFLQATKAAGGFATLLLPPVRSLTAVTANVIEPGYTPPNSSAESTCEATTGFTFVNEASSGVDSDNEFIGTNCVTTTGDGSVNVQINTPKESLTAGRYRVGFRIKGTGIREATMKAYTENNGADGTLDGETGNLEITGDYQYHITPPVIVGAADTTPVRVLVTATTISATAAVLFIDSICIMPDPVHTWHIGADARAGETVAFARTVGAAWVDSFTAAPSLDSRMLEDIEATPTNSLSPMFLRTWKVDANNYLELTYDPSTRLFSLVPTIATSAQTAIALTATSWHGFAPVAFVVEADAAGITLRMNNGNTWETVTGATQAALLNVDLTVQSGDNAKANLLPHALADGFGTT